ncbi:MAG: beta-ketoacyl-ACP synthase III [Planctomycetota bacterium]
MSGQGTQAARGIRADRAKVQVGVRIAGTGHHVPEARLTNADLESFMETSDEWIVQRTGIRERRICDAGKGETPTWLCTQALNKALANAGLTGADLDLVILGSVTQEMTCPSTACRVAANVEAANAGAFDVLAACSGFLYSLNIGHDMIRAGSHRTVAVIGCDVMSRVLDFSNRAVCVLFGDSAGAAILRATDDASKGMVSGFMHSDGSRWDDLYIPRSPLDVPEGKDLSTLTMNSLQMNGREVYKFAVGTFGDVIQKTLDEAGVEASDVDMYVCHQSNARMLESARKRFGLPPEKLYININRFGNCSAGSVPVAFDELRGSGQCGEGQLVMFVAFGGGLTWASALWQL